MIRKLKAKTTRALFTNDWHCPYHDSAVLELIFEFAAWFKPDDVYLLGDLGDFYQVSRYNKDPDRAHALQDDLDEEHRWLAKLRKHVPKARIVYIDGNHEERMTTYLRGNHPALAKLRGLQIPTLLDLDSLGIEHHKYREQLQWHGLLLEHGSRVCKRSAYTAAAMLDARGVSGLSAHTHRLGTHYRTNNSGTSIWLENGCACQLDPEYIIGLPDWQQGFSIGYGLGGDERFIVEQIPILRHKIFYQGVLFVA